MQSIGMDNLEISCCPLCGSLKTYDNTSYDLAPYKVVRCQKCHLWYLSPRLKESEMMKLYSDDSYFGRDDEHGYSSYEAQQESLKRTFRRFLAQLKENGYAGGSLLEVGCGYGYLLEEAKPYFSRRVGTDYSMEAVEQASKICDQVTLGGVDDVPSGETFDIIITVGVIEHIYSPVEFVKKLHKRLSAHGKLILATPHMGSFWRYIMGRGWPSFKVPEHVTYYDSNSLRTLFEKGGFQNMRPLSFPHAFPLSLIGEKVGINVGDKLGALNMWLPATTLALVGEKE